MDSVTFWLCIYPISLVLGYICARWSHKYERTPLPVLLLMLVPVLQWGLSIVCCMVALAYLSKKGLSKRLVDKILGGKGGRYFENN